MSVHIKCISSQNVFGDLSRFHYLRAKPSFKSPESIKNGYRIFCLLTYRTFKPPPPRADAVALHLEPEPLPRRSQVPVLPVDKY